MQFTKASYGQESRSAPSPSTTFRPSHSTAPPWGTDSPLPLQCFLACPLSSLLTLCCHGEDRLIPVCDYT